MYSYEIKLARAVYGATQTELAEMLEVTPCYLSFVESGRTQVTDSFMEKFTRKILKSDRFRNNLQLFNESVRSALRRY